MPMEYFKIFERIINGDLRPHNFKSDGKKIENISNKFHTKDEEFFTYLNYLDKHGRPYELKVTDPESKKIIYHENKNENFNELIDLDIPPYPDHKGEIYLEIIEYEYVINIERCKNFIKEQSKEEIEEYALKNFQILEHLWRDLKLYKKLIIKDQKKGLNYENSDEFVIWAAEVFLERTIVEYIELLTPYVSSNYLGMTYNNIFAERNEKMKRIGKAMAEMRLRILAKQYEKDTNNKLPWSPSTFKSIQHEISKIPEITKQIIIYKDALKFLKQAIIDEPDIDSGNMITKDLMTLLNTEIENLEYKEKLNIQSSNPEDIKVANIDIELKSINATDKDFDKFFNDATKADNIEDKLINEISFWQDYPTIDTPFIERNEKVEIAIRMLHHYTGPITESIMTGKYLGKPVNTKKMKLVDEHLQQVIQNLTLEIVEKLKKFKRGELQRELKKYVNEFHLAVGMPVESKTVNLITRKLIKDGWDATNQSVAVTLRKMGYGEERKKW